VEEARRRAGLSEGDQPAVCENFAAIILFDVPIADKSGNRRNKVSCGSERARGRASLRPGWACAVALGLLGCGGGSPPNAGQDASSAPSPEPAVTRGGVVAVTTEAAARALLGTLDRRHARPGAFVLPPSSARISTTPQGLVARFDASATRGAARADASFPSRADGATRLVDAASALALEATLLEARAVTPAAADGWLVYEGALGPGASVLHRPTPEGYEDYVAFDAKPARESLAWTIALGDGVAGLRLVADTLELVDHDGTPRLRVAPPSVIDARGALHAATLRVEGCAVDRSGAAPWGRTPIAPGASRCTVRVDWSGAGIAYPALVDPAWTTTGAMITDRTNHTATPFNANASVLVTGGRATATGSVISTCEIYSVGTGTWAATASLKVARYNHGAAQYNGSGSQSVFVFGGLDSANTVLATGESYVGGATPTVTLRPAALRARNLPVLLPATGVPEIVFVVGGTDGTNGVATIDLFNNSAGIWLGPSGLPTLKTGRWQHAAVTVYNGGTAQGMVIGGRTSTVAALSTTEVFDLSGSLPSTVADGLPLTAARALFGAVAVGSTSSNTVVTVSGGVGAAGSDLSSSEIFNVGSAWSPGPTLLTARHGHAHANVAQGVLAIGGLAGTTALSSTELLKVGGATGAGPMVAPHGWLTATTLATTPQKVLVTGGGNRAEVWSTQATGAACTQNAECTTGFCVDGVCCEAACTAGCNSCSLALTGQSDGKCRATLAGKISHAGADCVAAGAASCGLDGTCNGAGICAKYAAGTQCVAGACSSETLQINARTCDGGGSCKAATTTSCTAGYACTPTSCTTKCAADGDCATGFFCSGTTCVAELAVASACGRDRQCSSGHCADGFCCDKPCAGNCEVCAKSLGATADGACTNAGAGTDPRNRCPADAGTCLRDGLCDGVGACRTFTPSGTTCATPTCATATTTTSTCDGAGVCAQTMTSCVPFACNPTGTACAGSCGTDADCSGGYCDAGICKVLKALGAAATAGRECQSGLLADGVCCNAACDGICEACDLAATKGTCSAVAGNAKHGTCAGATGADPCTATLCDGATRTSCAAFVTGASLTCRGASCIAGIETQAATCNGGGQCPTPVTKTCDPYVCAGDKCATACASDADCAKPNLCDKSVGKCGAAVTCVDDHTVKSPTGEVKDCTPYRCSGNGCPGKCTTTDDCLTGYLCDPASQICQPLAGDTSSSGSCALGSIERAEGAGRAEGAFAWLAALGLGALVTRRARRAGRLR
jgi:hypothetical protein